MKNNSALSVMVLLAVCVLLAATVFIISSVLPGFGGDSPQPEAVYIQKPEKTADLTMQQTAAPQPDDTEPVQTDDGMAEPENTYVQQMPEATKQPETEGMQTPDNESDKPLNGIVIGLDPGHQAHSNKEKEPQSPGSDVMKKRCPQVPAALNQGWRSMPSTLPSGFYSGVCLRMPEPPCILQEQPRMWTFPTWKGPSSLMNIMLILA